MLRIIRPLGLVLCFLGLLVALFPFISVWRATGQMLDQLPEVPEAEITDQRFRLGAMFDDDFVLAQRTYTGVSSEFLANALANDSFERIGVGVVGKECCGDYDAVWVEIQAEDQNRVIARLTAADSDWQVSWWFFALFGLLIATTGAPIAVAGGEAKTKASPPNSLPI